MKIGDCINKMTRGDFSFANSDILYLLTLTLLKIEKSHSSARKVTKLEKIHFTYSCTAIDLTQVRFATGKVGIEFMLEIGIEKYVKNTRHFFGKIRHFLFF